MTIKVFKAFEGFNSILGIVLKIDTLKYSENQFHYYYIYVVPPFVSNPRPENRAAGFPLGSGLGGAAITRNKWLGVAGMFH